MKKSLIAIVISLTIVTQCFAYGGQGHRGIAKLAQDGLNNQARMAIQQILPPNTNLADIATWPDDLKRVARGDVAKGDFDPAKVPDVDFNQRFSDNGNWHFVNLPLGLNSYTDDGDFSDPRDIVHIINQCIRILELPGDSATFAPAHGGSARPFKKVEALRFLVHLVGDIHQPLHVGTGYFHIDNHRMAHLLTLPAEAAGAPDDLGGNDLFFSGGPELFFAQDDTEEELHAYWDSILVAHIADGPAFDRPGGDFNFNHLAARLASKVKQPNPAWKTSGDFHTWAEQWATDSLMQAREAYSPLTFGRAKFGSHNRLQRIETTVPDDYGTNQMNRATNQLAKAGFHLKELLNSIKWK